MRLFDVAKVGVFCDSIRHHDEEREDGEVKVISLGCRVEPFDATLALAIDPAIRNTLFRLNHPDPQPHIRRCEFTLGLQRQQLQVFASRDTARATIALDYVQISKLTVRALKDARGFALLFVATFGPVAEQELAYVEGWRSTQRAVTFEPAEPNLDLGDDDATPQQNGLSLVEH